MELFCKMNQALPEFWSNWSGATLLFFGFLDLTARIGRGAKRPVLWKFLAASVFRMRTAAAYKSGNQKGSRGRTAETPSAR
jgi:hypothetical protein